MIQDGVEKQNLWEFSFIKDSLVGNWRDSARKQILPIKLKAQTNNEALFNVLTFTDSLKIDNNDSVPYLHFSLSTLSTNKSPDSLFINNAIKQTMRFVFYQDSSSTVIAFDTSLALDKGAHDYIGRFFEYTTKQIVTDTDHLLDARQGEQYYTIDKSGINYNDKGFINFGRYNEVFMGGAHSVYHYYYSCFDIISKRKLSWKDILNIDSASPKGFINEVFRKQNDLPLDGKFDEWSAFNRNVSPTDNFYFTTNGISFVYNVYEIAPYAAGAQDIFIPFEKIKKYLTPDFKKRMDL